MRIVGILLAAGRGARFGGDKLLAPLGNPGPNFPAGAAMGAVACRRLRAAVGEVVAVVRPGDATLAASLHEAGARVVVCDGADEGMGASLAWGVAASSDADAWLVALADMPWIADATLHSLLSALRAGTFIAAPFLGGRRGHPVGFGAECGPALLALSGDEGARSVIAAGSGRMVRVAVDDPGILRDVDTPADLA